MAQALVVGHAGGGQGDLGQDVNKAFGLELGEEPRDRSGVLLQAGREVAVKQLPPG